MKKRSLRTEILSVLVVILTLLAGLTTAVVTLLSARDLRAIIDERVKAARVAVEDDWDLRKQNLTSAIGWFERSSRVVQLLARPDERAAADLAALAVRSFGADFFVLCDPEGKTLSRYPSGVAGEDRPSGSLKTALGGRATVGMETTADSLTLVGITPVYDPAGRLVGAVVLGQSLSDNVYVDRMKTLLDAQVTVFGGDKRLATTLTDPSGQRLVGTKLGNPVIEDTVLTRGEAFFGSNRIQGQSYSSVYLPVRDESQRVVGMVFAGVSLGLVETSSRQLALWATGTAVLVLLLSAGFLVWYFQRRLIRPLVSTADDLVAMAVGREPSVDPGRTDRADEMGVMSRSLADLGDYLQAGGAVASEIAHGNLAVEPRIAGPDDRFGHAFVGMVQELNRLVAEIRRSSDQVSAGIRQIAEGTAVLSSGATEGAASLEQMGASLQEIVRGSESNSREAQSAAVDAAAVNQAALAGSRDMAGLLGAMDAIESSARQIQGIVKTIDDIAFQVNLLALNANVEAARAGKYGKGFGVVAEEVRTLARRSADAVRETTKMVAEVQARITEGVTAARGTGQHLAEVTAGVGKIAAVLTQVADRSAQQSSSLAQLNGGMDQLSQVTQTNAATAEQSASVTQELIAVADALEQSARRFVLKEPRTEEA